MSHSQAKPLKDTAMIHCLFCVVVMGALDWFLGVWLRLVVLGEGPSKVHLLWTASCSITVPLFANYLIYKDTFT